MNIMAPTLKQLRYLVALAEHQNFRKAADACFISQPALSEQIQLMESLLEVQLVERSNRKVMITPLGREIVKRSQKILLDVDEIVHVASLSKAPFAQPLKMGVIPTIAPYLLPRLLKKLRKTLPKLKLYLREEQTLRLLELLRGGKLDFLILALPIGSAEFVESALYQEDFVLISPNSMPIGQRTKLKQADLANEQVLLLEEGHCLRDQALDVCDMVGAIEAQEFRASSLNTLVQMVANGLGITLLPKLAIDVELKGNDNIRVIEFAKPAPSRTVGIVWRKQSARQQEFETLKQVIEKNIPKEVVGGLVPSPSGRRLG